MIYKIFVFVERNRIVTNREVGKNLLFHPTFYYKKSVNFNQNKTQDPKWAILVLKIIERVPFLNMKVNRIWMII